MSEYNPIVPINVGGQDQEISIGIKKQGAVKAGVSSTKQVPMSVSAENVDIDIGVNNDGMININIEGGGQLPSDNYNTLRNKPSLNGVTLQHNKDFDDVGLHTIGTMELLRILT